MDYENVLSGGNVTVENATTAGVLWKSKGLLCRQWVPGKAKRLMRYFYLFIYFSGIRMF